MNNDSEKNYWNSQEVRDEWKGLHDMYFSPKSKSNSTECFVATAIGFEPKLMQRFYNVRDEILAREFLGKIFVKIYYNGLGKRLAKVIQFFDVLKPISRRILLKILTWKENRNER